jgi:hypothetical protein
METIMRFYNRQHRFYAGIDLHARLMHVCVLDAAGTVVYDRSLPCHFPTLLQAIAPYREDIVIGAASGLQPRMEKSGADQKAKVNRVRW